MKVTKFLSSVIFLVLFTFFGFADMTWVSISEPNFTGQMSKYETTNVQYCKFLNEALATGDITVNSGIVYGEDGTNGGNDFVGEIYFETYGAHEDSPITYNGCTFSVRSRDGYDMLNHAVMKVSWYGATAFCNYYGYRLPTEWEWQAVADYDGTYIYGCGTIINKSIANYDIANPHGLSTHPYTSEVGYYPAFGYGICDLAGNVWEWTSSSNEDQCVLCGGSYANYDSDYCKVTSRSYHLPSHAHNNFGFRVANTADASGLVAYWPFEGDANDVSGNGHNGIVHGAILTEDRCENPNSAYLFDGGNGYIEVPHANALNPEDLTIALWLYFNQYDSGVSNVMVDKTVWAPDTGYYLSYSSNEGLFFAVNDDEYRHASNVHPDLNTWTHLAATYERASGTTEIFVNGQSLGKQTGAPLMGAPAVTLYFGKIRHDDYGTRGKLDEIRIYNCVLSECDIQELINICPESACEWKVKPLVDSPANEKMPVWSPDGLQIAFISDETGINEAYVINSDGSGKFKVSSVTQDVSKVCWRPDAKALLYHTDDLFLAELNSSRTDIQSTCNITNDSYYWTGHPTFSPDGLKIASGRGDNTGYKLCTIDSNCAGTNLEILHNYFSGAPSWSPDGTCITYQVSSGGFDDSDIWKICNGSAEKLLDDSVTQLRTTRLAWSQNANEIAFASAYSFHAGHHLGIVEADGSNVRVLDEGPASFAAQHYSWIADTWSPDGRSLLYSYSSNESGPFDIYLIDRDGSSKRLVASSLGDDQEARFSVDGKIAFQTNRNGNWDIYIAGIYEPNIEVSPRAHDFGDVELGTSRTVIVTISNVGKCELVVDNISFEVPDSNFAVTSGPNLPAVIEPNATEDVEITYTPQALGYMCNILQIHSNDPNEALVEVELCGVGTSAPIPPSDQIQDILDFFDQAVEDGTIRGRGRCPCMAKLRLRAFRHMLKAAGELIDGEYYGLACFQLKRILWRCDGRRFPPDFVKGQALPQLVEMIEQLRESLDCR